MIVFNTFFDITHADSLDFQIDELMDNLNTNPHEGKIYETNIFIDTKSKTVRSGSSEIPFVNNFVWVSYDIENNSFNLNFTPKSSLQAYPSSHVSKSLLFVFYDKSEDKLYLNCTKRFFYPDTIIPNVSIIYDENNDKIYDFKMSFDRWDLLTTFGYYGFSYYLGFKLNPLLNIYHDINFYPKGVFPVLDNQHLLVKKHVDIVIKSDDVNELEFKLVQFGVDFTEDFINKYTILDENGNTLTPIYKEGYVSVNINNVSKIRCVPNSLERIIFNNAFAILNSVVDINIIRI